VVAQTVVSKQAHDILPTGIRIGVPIQQPPNHVSKFMELCAFFLTGNGTSWPALQRRRRPCGLAFVHQRRDARSVRCELGPADSAAPPTLRGLLIDDAARTASA